MAKCFALFFFLLLVSVEALVFVRSEQVVDSRYIAGFSCCWRWVLDWGFLSGF